MVSDAIVYGKASSVKRELLFATHNQHKAKEVRELLPGDYSLITLSDIGWTIDIPEPFETYEENAKAKAYFVFERTGIPCFADDSGLAIDALDGRPGVHSARYAGPGRSSQDNIRKVLAELANEQNRKATFYAVIAYVSPDEVELFRGIVPGKITRQQIGESGFGYDPIFIPDGFSETFGQMNDQLKNMISHRARAVEKFVAFLSNHAAQPRS